MTEELRQTSGEQKLLRGLMGGFDELNKKEMQVEKKAKLNSLATKKKNSILFY